MNNNTNIKVNKKIVSLILLFMMLFGTLQPVFAVTIATSGTDQWVSGQFDSDIYTTDNTDVVGLLIRRLVNYRTGEKITVFCAEYKVNSPTRRNSYCNTFGSYRC